MFPSKVRVARRCSALPIAAAVIIAATSMAGEAAGQLQTAPLLQTEEFKASLDEARDGRARSAAERRSAESRERRAKSRSSFRGRMGREAIDLARRKFGPFAAGPVFIGKKQLGQRAERFVNDRTLLIDNGPGHPNALLEAVLPLRVERNGVDVPVDLTMQDRGATFAPAAPLVDVRFGKVAANAVELSRSGVGVGIHAEPSTQPASLVEDRVFFTDLTEDVDGWVVPNALGAEIFWQLRSPASSEELVLDLRLPAGANAALVRPGGARAAMDDEPEAVQIRHGSELLATIAPPTAVDAGGDRVDARYLLDGHRLRVAVAHRDADVEYPVMVDPYVYDQYGFGDTNFTGGWGADSNKWDHFWWDTYHGSPGWEHGLHIGQHGGLYYTGEFASYVNWAPGQTSYIYGLEMQGAHHSMPAPSNLTQNFFSGLGDGYGWQSLVNQNTSVYWQHRGHCADGRHTSNNWPGGAANCDPSPRPHNKALFGAYVNDYGWRTSQGHMIVRDVRMYMSDPEAPSSVSVSHLPTTDWRDDATYTSNVSASDPGLGIRNLYVVRADTAAVLGSLHSGTGTCGGRYSRCASSGTWAVTYGTASLPEGLSTLRARATDAVEHVGNSGNTFDVRVDRSKPRFTSRSGRLYERRNRDDDRRFQGLYDASYNLHVEGVDDRSGLRDIEVFIDDVSQRDRGGYSTTGTLDWTMRPDDYYDGKHTVKVVLRDKIAGTPGAPDSRHVETSTFDVTVDRRGDIYKAQRMLNRETRVVGTDWARLTARHARETAKTYIRTRFDNEERLRTRVTDYNSSLEDAYWVRTSDRSDDPNLSPVASFIAVRDAAEGSAWTTVETGTFENALQTWQVGPPAHGTGYELRRRSLNGQTEDVWRDASTKAPVRKVTRRNSDNRVLHTQFWSYDLERRADAEVPSDLFRVSRPTRTGQEEEESVSSGGASTQNTNDEETGQRFAGRSLGDSVNLNAGVFCFARALTHRQRLSTTAAQGTDDSDMAAADRGYPGRAAPSTGVDAYYVAATPAQPCPVANPRLITPPIVVWTMASASSEARAWADVYERAGTAVAAAPTDADFAFAGVTPVLIGTTPTTAYMIREDAGPYTSFLVEYDNVTVLVRGPITKPEVAGLIANLEVL